MGDPTLLAAGAHARCPACGASLRPGAPWCTLCYTDRRAAQAPAPPPGPPAAVPLTTSTTAATTTAATATGPALGPEPLPASGASWPCGSCGAANALGDSACAACGAGFLAGLREAEGPLLELPVVGDLGAMSRAQRLGLAAGVVLLLSALVLLLGVLTL